MMKISTSQRLAGMTADAASVFEEALHSTDAVSRVPAS